MSSAAHLTSAQSLIQAFAGINSTEELIIFVAGTDGMLAFCQELLDQCDSNNQLPLIQEIGAICSIRGVLPGALFSEVRKVLLALNRYHDAGRNHYDLLGLRPDASVDEVKRAYRHLSKKYHPDRTKHPDDEGKRFMEITGAYHALMVGFGKKKSGDEIPWRKRPGRDSGRSRRQDRRFFLILVIVLLVSLSGFSIFLSAWYTRQAAISQFPANSIAKNRTVADDTAHLAGNGHALEGKTGSADVTGETGAITAGNSAPARPLPTRKATDDAKDDAEGNRPRVRLVPPHPAQEAVPAIKPVGESVSAPALAAEEKRPEPPPVKIATVKAAGKDMPTPLVQKQEPRQPVVIPAEPIEQPGSRPVNTLKENADKGSSAPDAADQIRLISHAAAINRLINHYQEHYNNRQLSQFLNLFTENATENGHKVGALRDQYRSLFDNTRAIDMKVRDITWNSQDTGVNIRCRFKAGYTYNDGRSREHTGDINLIVVDEQGELKISSLNYVFRE